MLKQALVLALASVLAAACYYWSTPDAAPGEASPADAAPVVASDAASASPAAAHSPLPGQPLARVLVVNDELDRYSEARSRLTNLLDGLGLAYDLCPQAALGQASLDDVQLIIVAPTAQQEFRLAAAAEAALIAAIERGVNCLWIGPGLWGTFRTTNLADAFGLRYLSQDWADQVGVASAPFANLAGGRDSIGVRHEVIYRVEPTAARVEQFFADARGEPTRRPLVTCRRTPAGGQAVYLAMQMLNFWKADESADTYARAEALARQIGRLASRGYVARHPARDGHDATLLLRLEDYVPGGSQMAHTRVEWLARMARLIRLTRRERLPLNIALIPKYRDPYRGEAFDWASPDPGVVALRRLAEQAFDDRDGCGGSLIVHGYYHQIGDGPHSFSGDDWEMWNPQTEVFLPLAQQQQVTDGAFAEVARQWNIQPTIWETPHYIGNEDTARAASRSGFRFFTESDTKLFPNRDGFRGQCQGLLLNLPETAFNYPKAPEDIRRSGLIRQRHMLPRLVRLGAPVYVFYHNMSTHQERALENLLAEARRYDLWKPSLEQYGRFWLDREKVALDARIDPAGQMIVVDVTQPFAGFTLTVRLPDGWRPGEVTLDGRPVQARTRQIAGAWYVHPVCESAASCRVTVRARRSADGPPSSAPR